MAGIRTVPVTVPVTGVTAATAATAAAVPGASHRGAVATAANGASEIEAGGEWLRWRTTQKGPRMGKLFTLISDIGDVFHDGLVVPM